MLARSGPLPAVKLHRLEGIVAEKLTEPYRPGERSWIKKKIRTHVEQLDTSSALRHCQAGGVD